MAMVFVTNLQFDTLRNPLQNITLSFPILIREYICKVDVLLLVSERLE